MPPILWLLLRGTPSTATRHHMKRCRLTCRRQAVGTVCCTTRALFERQYVPAHLRRTRIKGYCRGSPRWCRGCGSLRCWAPDAGLRRERGWWPCSRMLRLVPETLERQFSASCSRHNATVGRGGCCCQQTNMSGDYGQSGSNIIGSSSAMSLLARGSGPRGWSRPDRFCRRAKRIRS